MLEACNSGYFSLSCFQFDLLCFVSNQTPLCLLNNTLLIRTPLFSGPRSFSPSLPPHLLSAHMYLSHWLTPSTATALHT